MPWIGKQLSLIQPLTNKLTPSSSSVVGADLTCDNNTNLWEWYHGDWRFGPPIQETSSKRKRKIAESSNDFQQEPTSPTWTSATFFPLPPSSPVSPQSTLSLSNASGEPPTKKRKLCYK